MYYHLVGICGVSMSGLARLLKARGNIVSGSDIKNCRLQIADCRLWKGHNEKHITKDIDEVIYTAASEDEKAPGYVELKKAREFGIKTTKRSKFIGRMINDPFDTFDKLSAGKLRASKIGIAVTGMHGKTTTSAMISLILEKAGYNPTCLVGTEVKEWKSNVRVGHPTHKASGGKDKEYFVAEACEYDRQMLDFRPKAALITNMEAEHLDTYKGGIKDIKQAFKKFVKLLPTNGLLVLCADDKNVAALTKYAKCKVKYYSIKKPWPGLKLKIPGKHNLQNATGAARLCHELGVSSDIIKNTLNNFSGAGRRSEIKGEKNGVLVIDDYGHHPTEIKATLQATRELLEKIRNPTFDRLRSPRASRGAKSEIRNKFKIQNSNVQNISKKLKSYKANKLIVVYQPHQQQRTRLLFKDFIFAFDKADKIIMNKVYLIAGREKNTGENLAQKLTDEIKKRGKDIVYFDEYDDIIKYLKNIAKRGDLILTMGATDIYKVAEGYLK